MSKGVNSGQDSFIYLILGCLFIFGGISMGVINVAFITSGEFPAPLLLVPAIVLIAGIFCLRKYLHAKTVSKKLKLSGTYVVAQIVGGVSDFSQQAGVIVTRPTYRIECKYIASDGTIHMFLSKALYVPHIEDLIDKEVRVYTNDTEKFTDYFVDLDSINYGVEDEQLD